MLDLIRSRKQIAAPLVELVSAQELADQLRLDQVDQPELLEGYCAAARAHIEQVTWRQMLEATWRVTLDGWPVDGVIELPYAPLRAVTSIQYRNAAGALVTIDPSAYFVDTDSEPGRLEPAFGETWPTARQQSAAIVITFTAGYGTAASAVPHDLRAAVRMLAAHLHEHREATTELNLRELPIGVANLIAPHRLWSF